MWEIVLSSFLLQERRKPAFLSPWLRLLKADLAHADRIRQGVRMLSGLAPQGPYFPDFLTPAEASEGLDAGLDAVARTPRARLDSELGLLAAASRMRQRATPAWVGQFTGDKPTMEHLIGTLREYHQAAIAPHHDVITTTITADVAHRSRALRDGGVEGFFRSFGPLMTWRPPVLEIQYDVDQHLHLRGRGLRFTPSFFCHGSPVSIADPDLTPVIIYPVSAHNRWAAFGINHTLTKLLGSTRAAVLSHIADGASTTDLARTLSTSPASVSRHTTVLREAGLLSTHRHRNTALHTLTVLGGTLLNQASPQN